MNRIEFIGEESNLALDWELPTDSIYGCRVVWPEPISYYGKKDVWEYIEEVEEVLRDLNEELDR